MSVIGYERRARVESNVRVATNEWIVMKARVLQGIGYDEDFAVMDRVGAKGDVSRRFPNAQSAHCFEPLPFGVDEADEGDWCFANLGSDFGEIVDPLLEVGVENLVSVQSGEPFILIFGWKRCFHFATLGGCDARTLNENSRFPGKVASSWIIFMELSQTEARFDVVCRWLLKATEVELELTHSSGLAFRRSECTLTPYDYA